MTIGTLLRFITCLAFRTHGSRRPAYEALQRGQRSSRLGKIKVGLSSGAVGLVVGAAIGSIAVYFLSR